MKRKYNAFVVLIIINTVTQLAYRLQFCHSYIALFHNYKYYDYAYAYAMSVPFSPDGLNADMLPLNQELIFYFFFFFFFLFEYHKNITTLCSNTVKSRTAQ